MPTRLATALALLTFATLASPLEAALNQCATSWSNFDNPGFISEYTYQGQVIADEETSADTSHGPAAVTPTWTDLASGSPGAFPGPEATSFFGYYNGGTVYDPDDPVTLEDDYILFRMRVEGNPSTGAAFDSKHWNVLFDVDGDGYKEYWVDLDGSVASGNTLQDHLKILYDDVNRQDIPTPAAARVEVFSAFNQPDGRAGCPAGSPGISHTRVLDTNDGTGDYWIEMQIPMTAFNDGNGNQVLFPDSPVAFVFSTGASNQDPLQKDFMHDLEFLTLSDPITFGDIIIPNGRPLIQFTDANLDPVDFYSAGDDVYIYLTDPASNTDSSTVQCVEVTVTNPSTGDDEQLTLCETGPASGIFTNKGGACKPAITSPSPAPSPPTAWITGIRTSSTTLTEDWTATYDSGTGQWTITGTVSGIQTATASHGVPYTSDGGEISFTLYEDNPANGTILSFCTFAADPLPTSTSAGTDEDGSLEVAGGDDIYVSFTNPNVITVTDTAHILGPCQAFIVFTRATGLPSSSFQLTNDPSTSDQIYVTVSHVEANTNPAVAETITVTLTGNDQQTLALTETGPDTGEFRNATGLATQIDDGVVTPEDNLWEDVDTGVVTATYAYTCGGSSLSESTEASIFYTTGGGRVEFTNGAGTEGVELYGSAVPVWLKVTDDNACATGGALTVTVTSAAGDSETITLYETFSGSGVYMNRRADLVTTAGSAVVTSASSTFVTDGVQAGDRFAIGTGPDMGLYTVGSVDSETRLTLTTALTSSRTGIAFTAAPLRTATSDGAVTAEDGVLEADHEDLLTVSYMDCDDGDADSTNDVKFDTARYNAPSLLINEVLFYPDTSTSSCQTEAVELYNASSTPIDATGYTITDEDGFSYTVPQLSGANIVLQPGETIYLSLWGESPPADFFLSGTYYVFTQAGTTFPSDRFADPASGDPADQVTLFDASGVVQDYVGWSSTLSPSIDFYSDDSPAVLRSLWQDDAFRDASSVAVGDSMVRSTNGYDTNQPSDWQFASSTTCQIIATRAFVSSFRAFREAGRIVVEWETSSQDGTLGFFLYRLESGRYVQATPKLVPAALDAPQGGLYRFIDDGARGEEITYVLMEVEASARGTDPIFHGPYTVSLETGPRSFRRRGRREEAYARPMRRLERERLDPDARSPRDRARRTRSRGSSLKIAIVEPGLYRIGTADIASGLGIPESEARRRVEQGRFRLRHLGRNVPWTPSAEGDAVLFWGEAADSIYTEENVYWLDSRRGPTMRPTRARARGATADPDAWYWHTARLEEDRFAATLVSTDPESDYWYWTYLSSGHPTSGRASFTVSLDGLATEAHADARLSVALASATDTSAGTREEHHAKIRLNGRLVGEGRWAGTRKHVIDLTFSSALLRNGDNAVEVEGVLDTGAPFSIFYVDGFELVYPRRYLASEGAALVRADGATAIRITGFADPNVTVLDVTEPRLPMRVPADVEPGATGYEVHFAASPEGVYAAVEAGSFRRPRRLWPDEPSKLRASSNAADYVVVAPEGMEEASEQLASMRRAGGLTAIVVALEDLYDEFAFGLETPHAIRDFLAYAHGRWARAPRFAVLAGSGTLDYRDRLGLGDNLVPTLMKPTPDGLYASDSALGDVDGDGWPEIAVGRIPAVSAEELSAYVAKLARHEASGRSLWSEPLVFVADDDPWTGAAFDHHAESLASLAPSASELRRIYLSRMGAAAARQALLASFAEGAGLVTYVGHGGLDRLADEVVLHTSDVPSLGNGDRLPLVAGLSCSINRFELAGFQSLGEALALAPGGGAAAVWAPSGLSPDFEAWGLGNAFFEAVFARGAPTLGEAILAAYERERAGGGSALMPIVYNLLGDPALELR